jgi:hypothetical protein
VVEARAAALVDRACAGARESGRFRGDGGKLPMVLAHHDESHAHGPGAASASMHA